MRTIPKSMLDEIISRLVVEFDPDRIVLFGSHAWGRPGEDSDLDLLVVVPDSDERPSRRAARAHRCLRGLSASKDVIVRTRTEMDRLGRVPASLEAEILEQGVLLYERSEAGTGPELAPQGIT